MKYVFSLLLAGFIVTNAFSQQKNPALNDLHIKWEVIENNHNNKPQSLTALTLSAHQQFALPAKGWKIYFNFSEPILQTVNTDVSITHINGDLFCLSPTNNFKGIAKNDSLKVEFIAANWLINITDAPQGFYLVWDKTPAQGYAINNLFLKPSTEAKQFLRTPVDKVEAATPQSVYEQNKSIRDIPADSLIKIFPTPESYRQTTARFMLDGGVNIFADATFNKESIYLKKELSKLLLPAPPSAKKSIELLKKPLPAEGYELTVTGNKITIAASSGAGIFYGIQSLKTLIPAQAYQQKQSVIIITGVDVTDKPRFANREVMLDVARNFQPKAQVLKLLDLMGLYKLNILHLHLTDDEGWRLAIATLPELTAVGAKRGHTLTNSQHLQPSFGSGPFISNTSGSGFYSRIDFIEILKYATEHHVTIIPEIESPGHARAAIKAMDFRYNFYAKQGDLIKAKQYLLRDLKDSSKYTSVQYWNDNVIDVSLPSTYNFIETVTAEIKKMYAEAGAPLQTIHYGGDEVPAGVWEKSPAYLGLAKADTAIKNTDDLWVYYYGKVNNIMKAHGLYITAWEEVGTHKVVQSGKKVNVINPALADKNIHLEVWNNVLGWGAEDLAYKLANSGYKVILSCVSNLYFDMAYAKAFGEPGLYWGGYTDVDQLFQFIPYNYFKNTTKDKMGNPLNASVFLNKEALTDAGKNNIVGLQGALWAETLKSPEKMEYMLLPKLLGLAERAWAKDPQWATETDTTKSKTLYNEAWLHFVNVLGKRELPRLTYYAGGFNYRIPTAGATIKNGQIVVNSQFPGFEIHYTELDKPLSVNSPVYNGPISIKGKIKLALFNNAGRAGKAVSITN
ncbi:MAG TPA: family 20 glycosylhydrolase [Mucilaginibacter sp.]|nr:family 20 glycosylhydrolase [Mucilaginibacter sp.]